MLTPPRRAWLRHGAYQAAFSGIGLAGWIGRSFGDTSLDQVLWHVRHSEGAAVQMGGIFALEFVVEVLLFPLLFAVLATLLHGALAERMRGGLRRLLRALPATAGGAALVALLMQFSVFSYAAASFGPDRFAETYVDPATVRLASGKPRNLVLIYLESMEQVYADPALFGRDLLAPLARLGGHSFPSYQPAPGATWTIAGMVATQCGLPLKVYTESDLRGSDRGRSFMPGATCLGDVLQARGYRNVFMGGAPLSFAGKGAFLRDHGYQEAWGRDEWERAGVQRAQMNEWGLHDSTLYEGARRRLAELHAAGQPFNLTLLTIDTHNPHGFRSPHCRSRGARDFAGIIACGAEQAAEFVEFARRNGYLRDTVVVILGDHLAVPNPVWEKLQSAGERRRIYNLVIADGPVAANTQELLPFDWYPTMLDLLGLQVEGERLALGYTAVGEAKVARPADRARTWSLGALRGSARYDALWQRPD